VAELLEQRFDLFLIFETRVIRADGDFHKKRVDMTARVPRQIRDYSSPNAKKLRRSLRQARSQH
jgi:hypothetical protein